MAKLVTTNVEFEGRYTEVQVLVDENEAPRPRWSADADLAVVGKPRPRADGAQRIAGSVRYTVDLVLPGMLHAAVLRSPMAHAAVRAIDVAAARRAPGVRAVIGPDEVIGNGVDLLPGFSVIFGGLLSSEPTYAGHAIAAVAADTPEQARDALAAFALELDPLPFDVEIEPALRAQRFTQDPEDETRGDSEAGLQVADVTIELESYTSAQIHTALEPHAALAQWDGDDALTVWLSTQAMFVAQNDLAVVFGLPKANVRVVCEYVGGGFGAKVSAGEESMIAAELARRARRPVRFVNSRHEEQMICGFRAGTKQTVRLAANRDGTLVGVESEVAVGMGVGGFLVPYRSVPMALYRCDNVTAITAPVRLNLHAVTSFRAPGVTEVTTVFEQAMDDLASKLEIDPLELRRRVHADVDQRSGNAYSTKSLLQCYDRAAELSNWADREALREHRSADGLLRGMGCASQMWYGGGGPTAHATVRLDGSGFVTVVTGIQEIGTGTLTAAAMVASEELGIPMERIRVRGGDTQPNVFAPIAGGSTTTPSVMPAVRAAAARVRTQLLDLAGDAFEIAPEDLALREGRFRSADNALDRPYTDVTDLLKIAQVAVDPGTGRVVVETIWAVHDVGRIINPLTAASQVQGGVIQGLGYALMEEQVVDPTLGTPTNATLDDYKLPTIADVPEIVVDFVQVAEPATDVGAKGLGEPPVIPTAAAIANAFAHATGRRPRGMPLTPRRVLEALA
jgi:xanthine dehydrogenase YagR molybdenum-binding subunit